MEPADRALNPALTKKQTRQQETERKSVMTTARATVRMSADRRQAPSLAADILDLFQRFAKALFDPYRPELHYMRGPGPKWHAKHDRMAARFDAMAVPAVARVRVKR